MHLLRHAVFIVVASFLSGFTADAAVLRNSGGPAEVPPSNYKSKQYVDSEGCVFVRAGVGNSVTWVPRVTRSRKLVCGYQPTFTTTTKTVQTSSKPAASSGATPGKPMATTAQTTTPPQLNVQTTQTTKQVKATPAPETTVVYKTPVNTQSATPKTVKTKTVQVQQAAPLAPPEPRLPKGYKAVWDDDRLNPRRGVRTERGETTMRMIWTDTVPRRLVPESGQDVKLQQAHIRYQAATGTKTASKNIRVAKASPNRTNSTAIVGRFIQIGSFGVAGNAKSTARKFHKMGLPVSMAKSGNQSILYLGPFTSNSDLRVGMNAARSAGFNDAFIK